MAHGRVDRRLAAILAADVAGYSRLMGHDEEGTLARLRTLRRELIKPKLREHNGRIVKTMGDGVLVEFASPIEAVRLAVEIQREMAVRNAAEPAERRIEFRIGINLGDVIVEAADIYGDGVNVAARLEALAEPGGVAISHQVWEQIRDRLPYPFEDTGEQKVKNIARPLWVYQLRAHAIAALDLPASPTAAAPRSGMAAAAIAAWLSRLVTGVGGRWRRPRLSPVDPPASILAPSAPRLSIVVLPFANLSNDPDQDYFADGITEDLTTDLSHIPNSFVIARHTAFTYKGKAVDVRQLGQELGVRYALEGSVRRIGDQVRITAQLIDTETGGHLWADRFEAERRDVPDVQNEITSRLARTLNVELIEAAGRRIEREGRANPDAIDYTMRGWAVAQRPSSPARLQEAIALFERALEIDTHAVDAKIGIAQMLGLNVSSGWSVDPDGDRRRATALLEQALEVDPNRAAAHFAMGLLLRTTDRLEEALAELKTAVALDGSHARAMYQMGQVLAFLGRPEEAIPIIEKSIRLNPRDPNLINQFWALGYAHLLLGHADDAIALLRKARAVNPNLWFVHLHLAGALGLKGDIEEAKASLAAHLALKPEYDTLSHYNANLPWVRHPQGWSLREKTLHAGLRKAGMPE